MGRVLVTGVAGFIGAHVARRFSDEGLAVVGVDDLSGGRRENVPENIEFVEADLADPNVYGRLPRDCDKILHLAGQSSGEISFDDPALDLRKNAVSTLRLIRHGMDCGVERLVYASSMSVYGPVPDRPISEVQPPQPLSCYGVGKLAAEGYLRVYQARVPFVALRMFNVYGPGQDLSNLRQGMVSIFLAQAITSGRIEVKGSLERFRDFIFIDDVVEAWWRAANEPGALNQTLNVGTGRRTTVGELLALLEAAMPGTRSFVQGSTPGDQAGIYADTGALRSTLGISEFTSLEEGMGHFVTWGRKSVR